MSKPYELHEKVVVTSDRQVDTRRGSMRNLEGVITEIGYRDYDYKVRLDKYPLETGFNGDEILRLADRPPQGTGWSTHEWW